MPMHPTHASRAAIARARFFLDKARASTPDSRVDFEAFLEASIVFARAALHHLQSEYKSHPDWKAFWNGLANDAAVTFFRVQRDFILKEAPPQIGQKLLLPSIRPGGAHGKGYVPATAAEFYYFDDPGELATVTIGRHLDSLATLLADAESRFN